MKSSLFFIGLLISFLNAIIPSGAQNISDFERHLEALYPNPEEEGDFEALYENLLQYYRQPLSLNRVEVEELRGLYLLSEIQIQAFLKHRSQFGAFLSVYELQAIPHWDLNTIEKVLPFLQLRERSSNQSLWQRIKGENKRQLIIRWSRILQKQAGYAERDDQGPLYRGDPNALYARVRISQPQEYSLGFTFEKDRGERWNFNKGNYFLGADYFSYHFFRQREGSLHKLALGDYQLSIGQGLIFSGGFQLGKGGEAIVGTRRSHRGLMPYTSSQEQGFFRGLGSTWRIGPWEATVFYSNQKRDATQAENGEISSLPSSGLHRSESEYRGRKHLREQIFGAHVMRSFLNNDLRLGISGVQSIFSQPLNPRANPTRANHYRQNDFKGKENSVLGLHWDYFFQNISFFGEVAYSKSGDFGLITGLSKSLDPRLDVVLLLRHYGRRFHSFYGDAFGESTQNRSEQGLYLGVQSDLIPRKLLINAYWDYFKFTEPRFRVDESSWGSEYLLNLRFHFTRQSFVFFQLREEMKFRNLPPGNGAFREIGKTQRRNYQFRVRHALSKKLSWQMRLQASQFNFDGEKTWGMAWVQDIALKLTRLNIDFRFALFNSDDFETRQYVYEKDVLWAFSIPAYQNKGLRTYLVLRYRAHKSLDLWLKWGHTQYLNIQEISSSGERIEGSARSDLRLQLAWKF